MFEMFSTTHIFLFVLSVLFILPGYLFKETKHYKAILFSTSLLLFCMECYKQYYYYFILQKWSVWIFPFQICSIPLYIFLLYPFYDRKWFKGIETFLITYTFLGAICALGYPEDMIKPQLILTFHSFLWHYLLIFLSSFVYFNRYNDLNRKEFIKATIFFLGLCLVAFCINLKLAIYGEISMFYLNPYIVSNQPVFHTIGIKYGIFIQNISYLTTIIVVTFIYHLLLTKIADHLK